MRTNRLTLIELLILIVVLFLALAIASPMFHCCGAREPARRANCLGNLKQIGVAMLMYSGDYSGYFPPTPVGNSLEPLNSASYLKDSKVYQCPSSTSGRTRAANSDYWYVGGGFTDDDKQAQTRKLAYDMFENHGGDDNNWVNMLFMDGHVEGCKPGKTFTNKYAVIKPPKEESK